MSEQRAWHALAPDAVADALGTGPDGLGEAEAGRRREREGSNELETGGGPRPARILAGQVASPLIAILLVAGVVAVVVGELIDAAFIAVVVVINTVLGFVQEYRAASAIEALMALASPSATVVRDGTEREVDATEVVPGDVVVLDPGARVPADLRLVAVEGLELDESLLTGESTVARKRVDAVEEGADLAERHDLAFLGTTVAAGKGRGYVVATGMDSALGAIAGSMLAEEEPRTPLQRRLDRFARLVAAGVSVAALVTFGLGVAAGVEASEMFLTAVTLAVSAVPEGLPVAFTVALALGVRRMARRGAVIRRLPAVETLGSTTVICADKTGTLTRNQMTVERVWTAAGSWRLDEERDVLVTDGAAEDGGGDADDTVLREALRTGVLTNEATWSTDGEPVGDPTEVALLAAARRGDVDPAAAREEEPALVERPFDPALLYSIAARERDGAAAVHVKGATEPLLERCVAMLGPDGEEELDAERVTGAMEAMAAAGLRVLATARGRAERAPRDPEELEPRDLVLLGLQGMMDPPRDGVAEAIEECRRAGIRVVMITGDHAGTAAAIAGDLGLGGDEPRVLAGAEIDRCGPDELVERVGDVAVHARMAPDHKLHVVHALHARGEVVTVTGDGVNDAPALKAGEIGVAMGASGTDVAREAAEMVLTDDDFVSIRHAVQEGRRTFDLIRQVTFFLVATGASEVLAIVAGIALGWPLLLLPAQILWLNVVTNGFQDVALAFERSAEDRLHRPPRRLSEGLLSRRLWERTGLLAVVMAAGTLLLFRTTLGAADVVQARSVALTALVVLSAALVYSARSEHAFAWRLHLRDNPFLLAAQVGALAVHAAALHAPPLQRVLRVEPIGAADWGAAVALGVVAFALAEGHKAVRRGRDEPDGPGAEGTSAPSGATAGSPARPPRPRGE